MREKIEYFLVSSFIKLVKIMPEKFTYKILHFFGNIMYIFLKKRRELAISNLQLAFKEKDLQQIKTIAKNNFLSISRTVAEALLVLSGKKKLEDFVEDENLTFKKYRDIVDKKRDDQGVVFITAHFGNWEILANFFAQKGFPMTIIGRRGDNRLIEDNITTPFRESYGNANIHKSEAMGSMVRTLKKGGSIGILIDQKAGKTNSVITTFFDRECTTTISVAAMKLKYDPLVIPAFSVRGNGGKLKFIFFDPIEYKGEDKDSKNEKIQAMTQKYNDTFEEVVRRYPEQWFWMHNRWKM